MNNHICDIIVCYMIAIMQQQNQHMYFDSFCTIIIRMSIKYLENIVYLTLFCSYATLISTQTRHIALKWYNSYFTYIYNHGVDKSDLS